MAAGLKKNRPGFEPYWTKARIAGAMLDWVFTHGRWPELRDWYHSDPAGRWPSQLHVRRVFGGWIRAQRYAGREMTPGLYSRAKLAPRGSR